MDPRARSPECSLAIPPPAATPRFRHILCVYPYRRELNRAGFLPPLGLECIAAVLKPWARRIDLVDLRWEAGRTRDFLRPETDLVAFSVNWDRETAFVEEEIRSVPPGVFTLVGGRHATEDPERWLRACPNITALVRGEGEEIAAEICRGVPLGQISGVSFRQNGDIRHNPNRALGPVWDNAFPDRRLRRHVYEMALEGIRLGPAVDLVATSRGCPFNCTFCNFSRNPLGEKRAWSARSPESVVAELAQVKAPLVGFTDDLFTWDMDRVERICDLLVARGIRKKYIVNARLEVARRPDVLRKMERAGFLVLLVGIESAHDKTLRSMRKGFDVAKIRECFRVLRDRALFLHGYFIVGNIGESVEEMGRIPSFAHELGLDTIALTMLRHSPYSGLDELVARSPGYHIAPHGKIYSDQCSIQELRALVRRLKWEFYTPGHILRVLGKASRLGVGQFLPRLAVRLPALVWQLTAHYRRRAKRRADRSAGVAPAASAVRAPAPPARYPIT
jgi:radical SAM superfamily enzyme YgiQ (UPF0313 family)